MVVCHCTAINDATIESLRADGATVDDVISICGAGGDCGGCVRTIAAILDRLPPADVATALV
jgi:bacterioferritin-associated ferredoxin